MDYFLVGLQSLGDAIADVSGRVHPDVFCGYAPY